MKIGCGIRIEGRGRVASIGGDGGGFTLVEVLMAAFVLGLGVLGLAALFAGAARQQQLSSQVTRSVSITQSADAMIAAHLGSLGVRDCNTSLGSVSPYGTGFKAHPGQWFVVPIKLEGTTAEGAPLSFVSINPDENWSQGDALFFRTKPNQQLPRLVYRSAPGLTQYRVGGTGLGLSFPNAGAPDFDQSFGVPRLLADSVVMRVVTEGYGCDSARSEFRVDQPLASTSTLTFNGDPCLIGSSEEIVLGDGAGSFVQLRQQLEVSDREFAERPRQRAASIIEMFLGGVSGGIPNNDVNCDGVVDYIEVDSGGVPLWASVGENGEYTLGAPNAGAPGQSLYQVGPDGVSAQLVSPYDVLAPAGKNVFLSVLGRSGQFTTRDPGLGQPPAARVRPINADWRFVSEIWLDSFEYRGHRLVSASDRVWSTPDASRESGERAEVAYSLLYRDLGGSDGAQYIVFTYALCPASSRGTYVPPERKADIGSGASPVRLVGNVTLELDPDLLQYYIEPPTDSEWLAQPGQVLVFAGDGGASPPFQGADDAVRVQFRRGTRGYLESPPRVGNRSLLDLTSARQFDVWAVQPSVTSLDDDSSEWGLRPIEARIFGVFGD